MGTFADLRDSREPGGEMWYASDFGSFPIPDAIARLIEQHDASGDAALGSTLAAWERAQQHRLREMFKDDVPDAEMRLEDDIAPYLEAASLA